MGPHVTRIEYDMEPFLKSCLKAYEDLVGDVQYYDAKTPFVKEDDYENVARDPASKGNRLICPWCVGAFPKEDFSPIRWGQ